MVPSVRAIMGDEGVVELNPTMGGEDFSYFANEVVWQWYGRAPGGKGDQGQAG